MTYLRSPNGDCFHCGALYAAHDSCTDACPEQHPRAVLPQRDGHLAGASAPALSRYDTCLEGAIECMREAFIEAETPDLRRGAYHEFCRLERMRRPGIVKRKDAA